jgi:hypothetical protein
MSDPINSEPYPYTNGSRRVADAVGFMDEVYRQAGLNPDDIPSATHWPSVPPHAARQQWESLRGWVDRLRQRFECLDHHVIPDCWWLHNQHVEALAALRDHESVSYALLAPATSPMDWIRAVRDTAALLRSWTSDMACGSSHQPRIANQSRFDQDAWEDHLHRDIARRSPHS